MSASTRRTISVVTIVIVVDGLFLPLYEGKIIVMIMVVISHAIDPVAANSIGWKLTTIHDLSTRRPEQCGKDRKAKRSHQGHHDEIKISHTSNNWKRSKTKYYNFGAFICCDDDASKIP